MHINANFDVKDTHFLKQIIFLKSLNSLFTVDFSTALLKIIPVSCAHRFYIQYHAQSALFCETVNLVRFRG